VGAYTDSVDYVAPIDDERIKTVDRINRGTTEGEAVKALLDAEVDRLGVARERCLSDRKFARPCLSRAAKLVQAAIEGPF
jgi:hypothetical protein